MKKVMIVDDDREFVEELAELVQDAGYAVETFEDSVTAFNESHRVNPAVILLDLKMDNLTGDQLVGYLKVFPETATIPIIGMSAYAGNVDPVQIAATCGFDSFLKKPFKPAEMIARINQFTGGAPGRAAPAAGAVPLGNPAGASVMTVMAPD